MSRYPSCVNCNSFLDTAMLSAVFFLFCLSGQPDLFLKVVCCAGSNQIKSNLKDRRLLKKQQGVFEKPDSDKNV